MLVQLISVNKEAPWYMDAYSRRLAQPCPEFQSNFADVSDMYQVPPFIITLGVNFICPQNCAKWHLILLVC